MSQPETRRINPASATKLEFNLPFIIRTLKKWGFASLCCACICMVAAYFAGDFVLEDSYTATALVTVTPKDKDAHSLSNTNLNNAITRNVDMWNSEILMEAIEADYPDQEITGSLKATSDTGAKMVTLTATAPSARDAYLLLREAISHYKDVNQYFDVTYSTEILTAVNKDVITPHKYFRLLYIAAGFFTGLLACWAILIYWTARTNLLYSESQAKKLLDAPVFGSLQKIPGVGRKKEILVSNSKLPLAYLERMDMLTSLVEQSLNSDHKKILMVTSVNENDGKSSVAANLALTLAQRNRRVLLLDLDFRNPSLWKIFGQKELADKNVYQALKTGQPLKTCVCRDEKTVNLDFLWQFKPVRDADGFLENSRLSSELSGISRDYDYVILDTPPIGIVRDAEVIAACADSTLLLVRQDTCYASFVNDVVDQLEECGAPCNGVVLNQCLGAMESVRGKSGSHYHSYHKYQKGGSR